MISSYQIQRLELCKANHKTHMETRLYAMVNGKAINNPENFSRFASSFRCCAALLEVNNFFSDVS